MFGPVSAYVLLGLLLATSWLFYGLRLYVRIWLLRSPGVDDLLLFLAMVAYSFFTAFAVGIVVNGLGTDVDDNPEEYDQWTAGTFYYFFSELSFIVSSTLIRTACGLMLLRILLTRDKVLRIVIIVAVWMMVAYSTVFFFISIFQCWPVSYFWQYMIPGMDGRCISDETLTTKYVTMSTLFAVHAGVSVTSDWILGAVPFFMMRHVQMKWQKKALICFLLSLGVLAGVSALIRVPLIVESVKIEFWDSAVPVAITTAIEPALGVIAVSCSSLMPLFKRNRVLARIASTEPYQSGGNSHKLGTIQRNRSITVSSGKPRSMSESAIIVERSFVIEEDSEENVDGDRDSERRNNTNYRSSSNREDGREEWMTRSPV